MQSITKRKNKKILIATLAIIVIVVAAMAIYLTFFKGTILGFSLYENHGKSKEVKKQTANDKNKESGSKSNPKTPTANAGEAQSSSLPPAANGKAMVPMTITAANQTSDMLQVRVLIQVVSSSGTCNLTMTKQNSPIVSKTAGVQALANSSTCKGFDIPLTALLPGTWQLTITFENQTSTGSASQSIVI